MNQPDRVQALTETLNKEWQAEHGNTPFPELVSLLTLVDTGVIYLQQPELVRGSTEQQLAIRATFGPPPVQGQYPTSQWRTGTIISDTHALSLADGQIDSIRNIAVGMYRLTDIARLPILEKSDRVRDNLLIIKR